MKLEQLNHQLTRSNRQPSVEQWDPPFCGDIDIEIKKAGDWYYMGTPINRMPLVRLFASVLTQTDGEYFLVTPVEKVRIKVAATPFIVTQWRQQPSPDGPLIVFTTNVGDEFILSQTYPLGITTPQSPVPCLTIHRGLQAGLHRNVYYQLADIAEPQIMDGVEHWLINSGAARFSLGQA